MRGDDVLTIPPLAVPRGYRRPLLLGGLLCSPTLVLAATLGFSAAWSDTPVWTPAGVNAGDQAWLDSLAAPLVTDPGGTAVPVPPTAPVLPQSGDLQVLTITQGDDAEVPVTAAAGDLVATTSLSRSGIPVRALQAYVAAMQMIGRSDPGCRLHWSLVAGIGRVESNHGRHAGSSVTAAGRVTPPILGPRLDGSTQGWATIRDTDGGRYDGDGSFDRAVGPMQFLPGTWRGFGADGDGDQRADPQDLDDAALGTARYLCTGDGDLTRADDRWAAVLRYNHSKSYAALVVGLADTYASGRAVQVPAPPPGLSQPAGRSASPLKPVPTVPPSPHATVGSATTTPTPTGSPIPTTDPGPTIDPGPTTSEPAPSTTSEPGTAAPSEPAPGPTSEPAPATAEPSPPVPDPTPVTTSNPGAVEPGPSAPGPDPSPVPWTDLRGQGDRIGQRCLDVVGHDRVDAPGAQLVAASGVVHGPRGDTNPAAPPGHDDVDVEQAVPGVEPVGSQGRDEPLARRGRPTPGQQNGRLRGCDPDGRERVRASAEPHGTRSEQGFVTSRAPVTGHHLEGCPRGTRAADVDDERNPERPHRIECVGERRHIGSDAPKLLATEQADPPGVPAQACQGRVVVEDGDPVRRATDIDLDGVRPEPRRGQQGRQRVLDATAWVAAMRHDERHPTDAKEALMNEAGGCRTTSAEVLRPALSQGLWPWHRHGLPRSDRVSGTRSRTGCAVTTPQTGSSARARCSSAPDPVSR
jgi:hypothetical protein